MQINNKAALDAAITDLEKRKILQGGLLIEQFKVTRQSLRPINLIKDSFSKLMNTPDVLEDVLKTATGIGVGVLSKKIFLGSSPSILKKLLSGVFEFAVAKSTITNADKIKAFGVAIYNNLFKKSSNNHEQDVL